MTLFRPTATALTLATDARSARAVLDGWDEVPLALDAEQRLTLWHMPTRPVRRLVWVLPGPDAAQAFAEQLCDARTEQLPAPAMPTWQREAVASAAGFVLAVLPGPTLRPLAIAPIVAGQAQLPSDPELRFVVLADGAPLLLRTRAELREAPAGLAQLHVDVSAAPGPLAGATVELQASGVRRRLRTDARGRATFEAVVSAPTDVTVLSDEHWFAPRTFRAEGLRSGRITCTAEPGAAIQKS